MLRKTKKEIAGRILCFFGFHSWKERLTGKSRAFFASIGLDTSYNLYCVRTDCDRMKRSK